MQREQKLGRAEREKAINLRDLEERNLFILSPEAFKRFGEMVDHPPARNPKLERLLLTKAPWERDSAPDIGSAETEP